MQISVIRRIRGKVWLFFVQSNQLSRTPRNIYQTQMNVTGAMMRTLLGAGAIPRVSSGARNNLIQPADQIGGHLIAVGLIE